MNVCVSSLLSSCVALTPRMLRLSPTITMYLALAGEVALEPYAVGVEESKVDLSLFAVVEEESQMGMCSSGLSFSVPARAGPATNSLPHPSDPHTPVSS